MGKLTNLLKSAVYKSLDIKETKQKKLFKNIGWLNGYELVEEKLTSYKKCLASEELDYKIEYKRDKALGKIYV
jgi:hypothetical protein